MEDRVVLDGGCYDVVTPMPISVSDSLYRSVTSLRPSGSEEDVLG